MSTDNFLDRQAGFRRFMAQFDPNYGVQTGGDVAQNLADKSPTAQAIDIAGEAYNPGTIQTNNAPAPQAQPAQSPLQMMSYQPSLLDAMLPKIGRYHAAQAAYDEQNATLNVLAQNPNVTPDMLNLAKTSPAMLGKIAEYAAGQEDPAKKVALDMAQISLDDAKKKHSAQGALQDYMRTLDQQGQPAQPGIAPPPSSSGPMGVQNNNPLNIRDNPANNWQGATGANKGFVTFDKPEDSFRAGAKILNSYAARGISTLDDAIKTYAPASDGNNPEAYADFVSKDTGISRNSSINLADPTTQAKILGSMQKIEVGQGNAQPQDKVQAGVQAASPLQKYQQMAAHMAALDPEHYGEKALAAYKPPGADGENLPAPLQLANEYESARAKGDQQRMSDIAMFSKASDLGGGSGPVDPNIHGTDYLSQLTAAGQTKMASTVQMIGDGQVKSSEILSRMPPEAKMQVMAAVRQYKPEWNARQYDAIADFNNGPHGDQLRFINNTMDHIETGRDLAKALKNGDTTAFNKVANLWAQQTGSAAPTNLQTAINIIGQEMVKAIVPAGGTGADRDEAKAVFSSASSPEQLMGAFDTVQRLMAGQTRGLKGQYERSTGKDDFRALLSPLAAGLLGNESGAPKVMNFDAQGNLIQ